MTPDHFQTFARYNAWANDRLYAACAQLSDADFRASRQAFFGSILGTLNHILVGDRAWLGRIDGVPSGITQLDEILFDDLAVLRQARVAEDERILKLTETLDAEASEPRLGLSNRRRSRAPHPAGLGALPHVQSPDPPSRTGPRPAVADDRQAAAAGPDLLPSGTVKAKACAEQEIGGPIYLGSRFRPRFSSSSRYSAQSSSWCSPSSYRYFHEKMPLSCMSSN